MAKKINPQYITQLIQLIGGKENIATATHCITRLRFVLNQPEIADVKGIEALPMVKGCFTNEGQFQVVIGPEVDLYYQELVKQRKFLKQIKSKRKWQHAKI